MQTKYDYYTGELTVVREVPFSDGERAKVRCYGADDVNEGVAIMRSEKVDVSITGNSTTPRASSIRCRYLQEVVSRKRQKVLLGGFGRRHGTHIAPG